MAHTINDEALATNLALGGYVVVNCNVRVTTGPTDGWGGNYDGVFPNNITDVETIINYSTVSGAGSLYSPYWETIYNYVNTYDWIISGGSSGGHIIVMGVGNYGTATGTWPLAVISISAPMDLYTNPPHADALDNPVNPLLTPSLDIYVPEPTNDRKLASPRWRYGSQAAQGSWYLAINASRTRWYFYQNIKDNLVVESMILPFVKNLPEDRSFYITVNEGTVLPGQFDHWFTTPLHIPIIAIARREFQPLSYRINSGLVRPGTRTIAIFGDSVSTYGGLVYQGGNPTLDSSYSASNKFGNIVTVVQSLYPNDTVLNISLGGTTTAEALTGIFSATGTARANAFGTYNTIVNWLNFNRPNIVVLRYGLADSILINNAAATLSNLEQIINHAQSVGAQVILIGLNPAFVITNPAHCGTIDGFSASMAATAASIDAGIVSLARTRNLLYANAKAVSVTTCSSPDGIHPFEALGSRIVDSIGRQLRNQIVVSESDTIQFRIDTNGIVDNTVIPVQIVTRLGNITQSDFASSSVPLDSYRDGITANVVVLSNSATMSVTLSNDVSTEGLETFRFRLRYVPDVQNVITVVDSSTTGSYSLTASPNPAIEGQTIRFSLATTNVQVGTRIPYAVSGVSSADLVGVSTLTGNFIVPEPAIPRLTNVGGPTGYRTNLIGRDGVYIYRDQYVVIADEIYWNINEPTGTRLRDRALRFRSDNPNYQLMVVVTPYTFAPAPRAIESQVINDLINADIDLVALDPYYFADNVWSPGQLLAWTKDFRDRALAANLRVALVVQGFARIGYELATIAYNNQLLALTGIEEFVVFGYEDGPDLQAAGTFVSLNNDFPVLSSRTSVEYTISQDSLTEGTEVMTLYLTGPGRSESVSVSIIDTSVSPTTTSAPYHTLTVDRASMYENETALLTYTTNLAASGPVVLTLSQNDVINLSAVSIVPIYDAVQDYYQAQVIITGRNIVSTRTVTIRAFRSNIEVASVVFVVEPMVSIPFPVTLDGNLGIVRRGNFYRKYLNIPGVDSYTLVAGSLPLGLDLTSSGIISGIADINNYSSLQPIYVSEFTVATTPVVWGSPFVFRIAVTSDRPYTGPDITASMTQGQPTGYQYTIAARPELSAVTTTNWVQRWGLLPPNANLTSSGALTVNFSTNILPLLRSNILKPNAPDISQLSQASFDRYIQQWLSDTQEQDYQFHLELTNGIDPVVIAHTFRIVHFTIDATNPRSWFAQNRDYLDYDPNQYYFLVMSNINDTIDWSTPTYIGDMVNGTISTFSVAAQTTSRLPIKYSIKTPYSNHMPQGLQLFDNGLLSGKISFRCSIDDPTNLPAGDIYNFTVRAGDASHYLYTERSFVIRVLRINKAPNDNVWIRAFPQLTQRQRLDQLLTNATLFPPDLIYRYQDPWWGLAKSLRFLFAPGVNPKSPAQYDSVLLENHYDRTLLFDQLRTAVALDNNLNAIYEVVYLTVNDELLGRNPRTGAPQGLPDTIDLSDLIDNYFEANGRYYYRLRPNGLENMYSRLRQFVGYYNPGVVPSWMSSVQPIANQPGQFRAPIGFIPAVVLAYTKPGASNIILERCREISWNQLLFEFDRYQLENRFSSNFSTTTNSYRPGIVVTFDNSTTRFDNDTTRITDGMEYAQAPEEGDKYLKFPTRGVYV